MPIPRYWKLVDMMPPAIMPATNSWPTVTPGTGAAWLPKMDPSSSSRTAGSAKMKATVSRSRKNVFSSIRPLARPVVSRDGSGAAAAVAGSPRARSRSPGVSDQFQVGVLERRPRHGQPGNLAAGQPGEVGDRAGRGGRLHAALVVF